MQRMLFLIVGLLVSNNHYNFGVLALNEGDSMDQLFSQQQQQEKHQQHIRTRTHARNLVPRNKQVGIPTLPPTPSTKTSWSELVGLDGTKAKSKLEQQEPNMNIVLVPHGASVTMDYRQDRIRIFLDKKGKVARTPMIG